MRYEHEFSDRHERMQLVLDGDFDAYFEEIDRLCEEQVSVAKKIMRMALDNGCVELRNGSPAWYYLHPSVRGYLLQMTVWDEFGPVRHYNVDEPEDMEHVMHGRITVTW